MKSCSAACVCFCKATALFAKEFINLSDFILKPPLRSLRLISMKAPQCCCRFRCVSKLTRNDWKGGGVIVVMVAISLSDVINCTAPGLNVSDRPADQPAGRPGGGGRGGSHAARCTMHVHVCDDESGCRLQRREATHHHILQTQRLYCQRGKREVKGSVFETVCVWVGTVLFCLRSRDTNDC